MNKLPNIHPGEVLFEEFLKPMNISKYRLAKEIGVSQTKISEIVRGKRAITADTALRLSKYFGNSAKFWIGLQTDYNLEEQYKKMRKIIKRIPICSAYSDKNVIS